MTWFIGMSDADISTQTLAYTVSAAYEARITVEFTNRSTSASATASLWVVPSGEGVANEHLKESGTTLGLAGTPQAVLTRRVIAPAGAKIYVQASNANVSCQLSGDVVSPDNTESALTAAITAATTFAAAGTGATDRTFQNKMRDIVSVKDFGATGDGVTNDSSAVATAVAATQQAGALIVPTDTFINTARVSNADGVRFIGPGAVQYTPSSVLGRRVQNPAGRENLTFGSEYLYRFINKITTNTASTVRISGDSTVTNLATALTPMLGAFPVITLTSVANSGKHTGEWVSTYLAADIAAAPDLLIWHWGMNDCSGLSRTLAQFETSLRAGLTTYRATVPVGTGGILLMTPNASSDGTNGRDELRNEKMRQIIRNAAEDFTCAYMDTYGIFQDAYVGIGGAYPWMDDPYADGLRGVHPQTAFARCIAGEVMKMIIPDGVTRYFYAGGVSNLTNSDHAPLSTDAPSVYPRGISMRRATVANGWPLEGFVKTEFPIDGTAPLQINWTSTGPSYSAAYMRTYNGGSWQVWVSMTSPFPVANGTLPSTALTSLPYGLSSGRAALSDGWPIDGYFITNREPTQGNYGYQDVWAYNSTSVTKRRTWTNALAWSEWRNLGYGQGANVASANNLVLANDGDYFQITGATQINLLASTNWLGGACVTLKFNGAPTVKHNQGVSGANKPIILNGAVDFVAAANNTLTLRYDATDAVWYEQSRKV